MIGFCNSQKSFVLRACLSPSCNPPTSSSIERAETNYEQRATTDTAAHTASLEISHQKYRNTEPHNHNDLKPNRKPVTETGFRRSGHETGFTETGFIETGLARHGETGFTLAETGFASHVETGFTRAESEDSTTAYSTRSGDAVVLNTGGARGGTSARNVTNRPREYQKWIRSVRFNPKGFAKKELGRFDAFGAFRKN